MDHDPASGAGIILLQILYQAAPAECVQTLSHCSCVNEVAAAQAAGDVGIYIPVSIFLVNIFGFSSGCLRVLPHSVAWRLQATKWMR